MRNAADSTDSDRLKNWNPERTIASRNYQRAVTARVPKRLQIRAPKISVRRVCIVFIPPISLPLGEVAHSIPACIQGCARG